MNDSIQALGWTLVHFCWQGTLIGIASRLIDSAASRARSEIRYALALASLMCMVGAGATTFAYENRRLADDAAIRMQGDARGLPILDYAPKGGVLTRMTTVISAFDGRKEQVGRVRGFSNRIFAIDVMPWIDGLWIAGVFLLSVRLLGGWTRLHRLQRGLPITAPVQVREAFARLMRRMNIGHTVKLHISSDISGPLAIGVLRSTILLPVSALTALSMEQIEVVLAHELAHIRRADFFWNIVQTCVETLFFFHPAVWWLSSRVRQLREVCCDDVAVAFCDDPVMYATALLQLEEQRQSEPHFAMALRGNGLGLKARIGRILGFDGDPVVRHGETGLLVLALAAVLSAIFVLLPRPASAEHGVALTANQPEKMKVPADGQTSASVEASTVRVAPAMAPQATTNIAPVATTTVVPPVSIKASTSAISVNTLTIAAVAPLSKSIVALNPAVSPHLAVSVRSALSMAQPPTPVAVSAFMQGNESNGEKDDYIKKMSELGYTDIDKLLAMKVQGVTPEYAKSMAEAGYGKPSAQDLISLKIFGITPETIKRMREQGVAPASLHDLISYSIFKVTPEYASSMKEAGFGTIPPQKLLQLRIQGVTPEYARSIRQRYPEVTVDQLVQLKIFRIDDAFIASAKSHGFDQLSLEKLVQLRISGLLDDNSVRR